MLTRWQPARHIRQSNSQKLTQLEEEVIVNYVADLNRGGNAPTYVAIRDMAGKQLLAARDAERVGWEWPAKFVRLYRLSIKMSLN
jgi:hypothetical protein